MVFKLSDLLYLLLLIGEIWISLNRKTPLFCFSIYMKFPDNLTECYVDSVMLVYTYVCIALRLESIDKI